MAKRSGPSGSTSSSVVSRLSHRSTSPSTVIPAEGFYEWREEHSCSPVRRFAQPIGSCWRQRSRWRRKMQQQRPLEAFRPQKFITQCFLNYARADTAEKSRAPGTDAGVVSISDALTLSARWDAARTTCLRVRGRQAAG
jgi:hypothetical protein